MQNRAKLIGATFSMQSQPGNGTAIKIILPK
jgi:signal transduction histidine kinase